MADEFRHKSVGDCINNEAEWMGVDLHIFNDQAVGDMPYASSTTQLSRRAIGATNEVPAVVGGVPTWQSTLVLLSVNASGNTTVSLPAAASYTNRIYTIKNMHSTGTVTIDGDGDEEIDGEATVVLNLQYQYVTIICDGTGWLIIGGEYVKMEDIIRENLEVQREELEELKNIKLALSKMSDLEFKEE